MFGMPAGPMYNDRMKGVCYSPISASTNEMAGVSSIGRVH